MVPLKTHVKYNVFAMTNLKTHAPVHKKRAKEHGKQQNELKPMRLCTKTKRNLKTHLKYNVFAMTNLKTHVRYNVFAMINFKTHVKYNVFAMTNLKTRAQETSKRARKTAKCVKTHAPVHQN